MELLARGKADMAELYEPLPTAKVATLEVSDTALSSTFMTNAGKLFHARRIKGNAELRNKKTHQDIKKHTQEETFDDDIDYDKDWVQRAALTFARDYKYFYNKKVTEGDITHRTYGFLDEAFEEYGIDSTRGEAGSKHPLEGDCQAQSLTPIARSNNAHKINMIYEHHSYEIGAVEVGIEEEENSEKA